MAHDKTIEGLARGLRDCADVRALFLSGSRAVGLDDAFSDIDFLAVVANGTRDAFARHWRDAVEGTGEVILWRQRGGGSLLINAINEAWVRIDVLAVTPDQMAGRAQADLRVVFDHDAIHETLGGARPSAPDPGRLAWQFEEFIRVLGLLHVAMGRADYLNSVTGLFHLRNLLVDLMVAETDAPNRGGALHLNRLITDDQQDALRALPPPLPTRDAAIAAHLAYAAAYLPRARRMAKRHGLEWPERFEAATWRMLARELGLERPYDVRD